MSIQLDSFLSELKVYNTDCEVEDDFLNRTIDFITNTPDPFSRSTLQGHITASAWILDQSKSEALLIHHRKLDRWFQPGGHIEVIDDSVRNASLREAIEETGIKQLKFGKEAIFDIDIHTIPENKGTPEHLHYDIRYCFIANSKKVSLDKKEIRSFKWIPLSHLYSLASSYEVSLQRMAMKSSSI